MPLFALKTSSDKELMILDADNVVCIRRTPEGKAEIITTQAGWTVPTVYDFDTVIKLYSKAKHSEHKTAGYWDAKINEEWSKEEKKTMYHPPSFVPLG